MSALRGSAARVVQIAAADIHPPLFYLISWLWIRIPTGLDPAVQERILTAFFGLLATIAADRLIASRLPERARLWFLALWCASPCLLLYTRMCRSYSMQVLAAVIAVGCLVHCLDNPGRKAILLTAAAIVGALYTHYAPGLALVAVANLALALRQRFAAAVGMNLLIAAGFLPWLIWLAKALDAWRGHGAGYAAIGGAAEIALKIGYWGMSAMAGEALPDALLIAALTLAPFFLLLVAWGARCYPRLFAVTAGLAVIGFIGVGRWVSYPFIPARLLFVLPFVLMLAALGAASRRRAGVIIAALMLALSLAADWCYFQKLGFRNKQYPLPVREIAALMQPGSLPLVDNTNSDASAFAYALGPSRHVVRTTDPDALSRLADPAVHTVWFVRNTHDVSPQRLNSLFEKQLEGSMRLVRVRTYEPFTPMERALMRRIGLGDIANFTEVLEFRR